MTSFLLKHRLVAIVRGARPVDFPLILEALFEGGVRAVEVTLNSEEALPLLASASYHWGDRLLLGAGTVMDATAASDAISAGAQFIISPHLDPDVVAVSLTAGVVSIPGAYTPTEIVAAYRLGAHIVKVFPASAGPSYLKDLRGPLPHIPLMPTGGVTLSNIGAFAQAGAVAFGVGSALVDTSGPIDFDALRIRARQFVEAIA
jgi:2-dehydro-3-deoxyphosphogluconate aldolase/(4S)-4-hydroxy-2-oxoglutarate aldolase